MFKFYLSQTIYKNDSHVGWYVKHMTLSIPPTKGMIFCDRHVDNESRVTEIWVSPSGAVICELQDNRWSVGETEEDLCDTTEANWPKVLAEEVDGWLPVTRFDKLPAWPFEYDGNA